METGQGSLTKIGLTDREGRKSGQNFKTDKLLKMTFIDKSVTGMYERRFNINGWRTIVVNKNCKLSYKIVILVVRSEELKMIHFIRNKYIIVEMVWYQ